MVIFHSYVKLPEGMFTEISFQLLQVPIDVAGQSAITPVALADQPGGHAEPLTKPWVFPVFPSHISQMLDDFGGFWCWCPVKITPRFMSLEGLDYHLTTFSGKFLQICHLRRTSMAIVGIDS